MNLTIENILYTNIVLIVGYLMIKLYRFCVYVNHMKKLPSFGSKSILGDFLLLYKHRNDFIKLSECFQKQFKKTGWGVVWLSFYPLIFMGSPQKIKMVLNNKNHLDRGWMIRAILHNHKGLLTLKDEEWKNRRRLCLPAFSSQIINTSFMETFVELSLEMVHKLRNQINEAIPLQAIVKHYAMLIALETSFGLKGRLTESEKIKWSDASKRFFDHNMNRIYKPYLWLPLMDKLIQFLTGKNDVYQIYHLMKKFIHDRLEESKNCVDKNNHNDCVERKAFLDHLIDVYLNHPQKIGSDNHLQALLDEVFLTFLGAFDGTSGTIHSVLFDLASNPDIQEELYQQLVTFDCEDKHLTINDFKQIPLLDYCIKESLRIRPSLSSTSRPIKNDLILDGYLIPKNTNIVCYLYYAHHDEATFSSPEKYDPERFKPENLTDKLKDAFFGFGDGPRRCVAEQLGLIKVKVVVSNIIKNFKIDLVPGQKHHIFADMTARFKEPPMFNLSLR